MQKEIEQKKKMESQSKEEEQPSSSPNKAGVHKVFLLMGYMIDFSHEQYLAFCKKNIHLYFFWGLFLGTCDA